MRMPMTIASSLLLSVTLWSAAPAAPATQGIEMDCQTVGGDVSALIDREIASPNISQARAIFQRGIMNCMEGDNEEANRLYFEAKRLLTGPVTAAEATTVARGPQPEATVADCQKFGSEVSALIDREIASPNVSAARATFQRGIMNCMEGDEEQANRLYSEAKALLDKN